MSHIVPDYPPDGADASTACGNTALRDMRALGLDAQGMILVGSPAQEIVTAALHMRANMIVMGHRHLSWFDRVLHPSTCWEVLEHADCPVLVSMAAGAP